LTISNVGNVPFAYDAMDQVGRVEYQPLVLAVSARSLWGTLESFAAACAAAAPPVRIANSGTGSATHLGALSITSAIGCEAVHLPIGTMRRNVTVLSGEADALVAPLTGAISLAKANRLRLLAILSVARNAVIPDVPTATELGVDAEFDLFRGLSVPKGTPGDIVARLADAMTRAARSEAFMQFAEEVGFTVAPMPSEAFEALLATEDAKVRAIIQRAGLASPDEN
jgi:tripartite-type tricarboxylate transporter receptor subunit TctC